MSQRHVHGPPEQQQRHFHGSSLIPPLHLQKP